MRNTAVLSASILLIVSCHGRADHPPAEGRAYRFRLNPEDSSTYRYNTTSETSILLRENGIDYSIRRRSHFTVNYQVTKDSNEVLLEMSFPQIDYHEWNDFIAPAVDMADVPGPTRDLLKSMKTATIFVRVHPDNFTVATSGAQEVVNSVMDAQYAPEQREQAGAYWGQWAEEEVVWKNVDPFVWVTLDSARRPGYVWADTSTNNGTVGFKIIHEFHFDNVHANLATFRSKGRIDYDSAKTWLSGKLGTGPLAGDEKGECIVDTATGMPVEMTDLITAEGALHIEGRMATIKILMTVRMAGGKRTAND